MFASLCNAAENDLFHHWGILKRLYADKLAALFLPHLSSVETLRRGNYYVGYDSCLGLHPAGEKSSKSLPNTSIIDQ